MVKVNIDLCQLFIAKIRMLSSVNQIYVILKLLLEINILK